MPTVLPNVSVPEARSSSRSSSAELRIAYVPETESDAAAPTATQAQEDLLQRAGRAEPAAYWSTCHVMPKVEERPWRAFWLFPAGCGK